MVYAFATLLTSDSYLPGALALAAALRDLHPTPAVAPEVDFQTVCLVTPETVDVSAIKQLRRAYNVVVGVEVIAQEDEKGLKLLGRLDLNTVLTKLHVFRLTQYSKIIFLDADVLPIRPLSHLFTLPYEFSAVPDVGWPDIFNSGVLVLSPGEDKFTELNELLKSKGTWDGGDQGILNEWRGNDWHRLSFTYNTTPTAAYTYAPAYERFGSQISAIHFIGPNKPWNSLPFRSPFQTHHSHSDSGPLQAYDYNTLLDRWFAVYDKNYRAQPTPSETEFEVKRYISAWDEQTGTSDELISGSLASGTVLGLEDLRKIALEGIQPSAVPTETRRSEGEYMRLPLEGRIDLMRPRKLVEEKEKEEEEAAPQTWTDTVPSTPRPSHTRSESPQRWETLATPRPDEVPPGPHLAPISLPPTPTPASYARQQSDQPLSNQPSQQHSSQQHPSHLHPPQQQHHDQHEQQPSQSHQQQRQEPPRPPSPPMLIWNPATEPPPTTVPSASAFPTDTYFPNLWDQAPRQQQHYRQGPVGATPPPDSNAFFQPPPPSQIPESLRREGHYRQVTGEESEAGATPSPDRSKVRHVFPWEEKPRQMPGRVFPSSDAPSPSLFVGPSLTPDTPDSTVSSQPRSQPLSPLQGLPNTLTYGNAWDAVPSIQRYASRLARSPQSPMPLAPAFEGDRYRRRRSWDDRTEASSMDGDDEDDGEDEDESFDERQVRHVPDSDSDRETTRSSTTGVRSRSGSSSISASYIIKGNKKEYRVRGVQTISPQMRSMGTQTEAPKVTNEAKPRTTTSTGRRGWAPSAADVVPPVTVHSGAEPSMTTASPSPVQQPGSPREFPFASSNNPSALRMSTSTPPPAPPVARGTPVERQVSNDGSLTSPPSSIGPISPPDAPLVMSPARKGSRVWDPARGVELFKRGSEEVLARFLKMGSWEDEAKA